MTNSRVSRRDDINGSRLRPGYENLPSQKVMQKLGMTIQHLEEPQPPYQLVVGVLENNVL
jgi:hypothetical protein